MSEFVSVLKRLSEGQTLSEADAHAAFGEIMAGAIASVRIAAFLTALAVRKPTVAEITGAARAMRGTMRKVDAPPGAIDVCGTGGDGHSTLNVSTAVAFVVAACGVAVAKHGNRSASSLTGAADVLEVLGVPVKLEADAASRALHENNFAFLFAQLYHPAMKHVGPVRAELGFRTIFNILGPICNPAGVTRQLIGVFSPEWIEPMANVLAALGTGKALVVHGADGLDEISLSGPTHAAILENGKVSRHTITPEEAGLSRAPLSAIKGGDAAENAAAIRALFDGKKSAFRDIVLLNAAAALMVADKAKDMKSGVALAASAIDSGKAKETLARAAQ
ncbi:MAG TPA: anthranilate phosphoribosyltransferase [Rhizomicrobium sp.]|nr:anthranilate phosphoribosyltransferase [Rhizomicrobium sp.]